MKTLEKLFISGDEIDKLVDNIIDVALLNRDLLVFLLNMKKNFILQGFYVLRSFFSINNE